MIRFLLKRLKRRIKFSFQSGMLFFSYYFKDGGKTLSGIISKTMYDKSWMTEIPVIVSFSTKGDMLPLYIRYEGERYQILSAQELEVIGPIKEFLCIINVYGRKKQIKLTYYPREQIWTIPRQI